MDSNNLDDFGYLTVGNFITEKDSAENFDSWIPREFFDVYSEVDGLPSTTHYMKEMKKYRIDRLLIPKKQAVELGWKHGVIGVEIKKSKMKLGPLLNQASDYAKSVFYSERSGIAFVPNWILIWPSPNTILGNMLSVMANMRVGAVVPPDTYNGFRFKFGDRVALEVKKKNSLCGIHIGSSLNSFTRTGSR